jgi:HEPN domain-containing protein
MAPVRLPLVAFHSGAIMGGSTPPNTYLGVARHMELGLDPLIAVHDPQAHAFMFLAAQVVECALKAALSRTGDDTPLRKQALRHDLEALWQLAAGEGLGVDPVPPSWLVRLSLLHREPYYLRYSKGVNGWVGPPLKDVRDGIRDLMIAVERQVLAR